MLYTNRLAALKDRHRGERAVLVANGPSLNRMDLSFLKQETSFGLNKIFLGFERFRFYPKYYVAVNRLVIEQAADTIKRLNCMKFVSEHSKSLVAADAMTHHIATRKISDRFSTDISQGVHEGWTVTHAALQVAYYLGFEEVAIIGLDHRYDYSGAPNEAKALKGPDPNHFSPEYFANHLWNNPDLAQSEESFRHARTAYEKVGRRIVDATLDGACTIFDKVDYRKHFKLDL